METHSQTKKTLEGQIRNSFGRVVYSHKTHEKCVEILLSRLSKIKIAQIVLSGVTTAGFIGVILGDNLASAIVGVTVSTALLIINSYTKDYDLGEIAQKHKQAAIELWGIREQYISLLVDIQDGSIDIEEIKEKRNQLNEHLISLYSGAPSTTNKAYKLAQEALKKHEDFTFSVEEINAFLPAKLKK